MPMPPRSTASIPPRASSSTAAGFGPTAGTSYSPNSAPPTADVPFWRLEDMRFALAFLPLLALAACGSGGDNASAPVTSSTPVAQAAPPAGKQWVDVVSKTPEGGYVQGNPNAPIKLVEYGARMCPTC